MPRSLIPVMTPHGSLRLDQADDDFVLEGGLRLAAPVGVVAGFRHALHRRPLRVWRCEGARRPNGACRADVKPTPRLSPATVEPRPIRKLAKRERDEGPKPQPSREQFPRVAAARPCPYAELSRLRLANLPSSISGFAGEAPALARISQTM